MEYLFLFVIFALSSRVTANPIDDDLISVKKELNEVKAKTEALQYNYTLIEADKVKSEQQQADRFRQLEQKFLSLQQDVLFINKEVQSQNNVSAILGSKIITKTTDLNRTVENKLSILESHLTQEVNSLKTDTNKVKSRVSRNEQDLAALRNTLTSIQRKVHSTIAFKAIAISINRVQANKVVHFDHVKINEGMAYKASTGQFTCPVSGLYKFFATVPGYKRFGLHMKLNGSPVDTSFHVSNTSSISALLKLNPGDNVWVSYTHVIRWIFVTFRVTGSFSGFLLSPLN